MQMLAENSVSDLRFQSCEVWLEKRRGRAQQVPFVLSRLQPLVQSCTPCWELSGRSISMILSSGYLEVRLLRLTTFFSAGYSVWYVSPRTQSLSADFLFSSIFQLCQPYAVDIEVRKQRCGISKMATSFLPV